jgi:predicted esterase
MDTHSFSVSKTTRHYTIGEISKTKHLLIVLHGYGQLANYFLKKFELLVDYDYAVIAPEGMHRFYLEGTSGRVGASWMTREARLDDIEDNFHYLENLTKNLLTENPKAKLHLLGFSQGAATATRWLDRSKFSFASFVSWASVFPEDVSLNFTPHKNVKRYFVLGDQDQYFTKENVEVCIQNYLELNFEILRFVGKHEINTEIVKQIFT